MSGGSHGYLYCHMSDLANSIEEHDRDLDKADPRIMARAKFAEVLRVAAVAAHDIEWVDSGDYGEGREIPAIEQLLGELDAGPEGWLVKWRKSTGENMASQFETEEEGQIFFAGLKGAGRAATLFEIRLVAMSGT